MNEKKPAPLFSQSEPKMCPICGTRSYSLSGIHPQCAQKQADAVRQKELLANKKRKVPKVPRAKESRWKKKCPKCNAELHVRKKVCDCGFEFALS